MEAFAGRPDAARRIVFVGVSTGGSVVRRAFPGWMELLGAEHCVLDCVDLPVGASPAAYRDLVLDLSADPLVYGAVITAHKAALFEHAADLLAGVSPQSRLLGETSVLYRPTPTFTPTLAPDPDAPSPTLYGTAIECESVTAALCQMGDGQSLTSRTADLVALGAGGTTRALLAALGSADRPAADRPRRIHLIDLSARNLALAAALAARLPVPPLLRARLTAGSTDLSEVGPLPPGSLIVNATGLGKDRPGSPLRLPVPWPQDALVWDLNYRGARPMLADARSAPPERRIRTFDGWSLFIHGWARGLEQILGREIGPKERAAMDEIATTSRPDDPDDPDEQNAVEQTS